MPITATQKLAVAVLPLAAFGLALATSGPDWGHPGRPYGSWKDRREGIAAAKAPAAPLPGAPEAGPGAPPAPPDAPKAPATPPKAPLVPPPTPKPEDGERKGGLTAPAPADPAPALPKPEGIEFRASGLSPAKSGVPLRFPASDRVDVHVLTSGGYKVGTDFMDPALAKEALAGAPAEKKEKGLLFLVPNARAPWDAVKDAAAAGLEAGWTNVGLCVATPGDAGLGRVLELRFPSNDAPALEKGLETLTVQVVGSGPAPSFKVNGEEVKDAAALEEKLKALHEECLLMAEDYAADPDRTPWIVDGAGSSAGGVVAALDALGAAGAKAVRIAGLRRPAPK